MKTAAKYSGLWFLDSCSGLNTCDHKEVRFSRLCFMRACVSQSLLWNLDFIFGELDTCVRVSRWPQRWNSCSWPPSLPLLGGTSTPPSLITQFQIPPFLMFGQLGSPFQICNLIWYKRNTKFIWGKSGLGTLGLERGFSGWTQPWSKVSAVGTLQLLTPPSSSPAPSVSNQREGRPCSLMKLSSGKAGMMRKVSEFGVSWAAYGKWLWGAAAGISGDGTHTWRWLRGRLSRT